MLEMDVLGDDVPAPGPAAQAGRHGHAVVEGAGVGLGLGLADHDPGHRQRGLHPFQVIGRHPILDGRVPRNAQGVDIRRAFGGIIEGEFDRTLGGGSLHGRRQVGLGNDTIVSVDFLGRVALFEFDLIFPPFAAIFLDQALLPPDDPIMAELPAGGLVAAEDRTEKAHLRFDLVRVELADRHADEFLPLRNVLGYGPRAQSV